MIIRVIPFEAYDEYFEKKGINVYEDPEYSIENISDEQFMEIYRQSDFWEFNSIAAYVNAFNSDDCFAPLPGNHFIRVFCYE